MTVVPRSLRGQLLAAFLAVALLPASALGGFVAWSALRAARRSALEHSGQLAAAVAAEIGRHLEAHLLHLREVQVSVDVWREIGLTGDLRLQQHVAPNPAIQALLLLDERGRVADVEPPDLDLVGNDFSRLPYAAEARRRGAPTWSSATLSPRTGRPVVSLVVPGHPWTLVGYLDLAVLRDIVARVRSQRQADVTVIDRDGTILAAANERHVQERVNVGDVALVRQALAGRSGTDEVAFLGTRQLASAAQVSLTGWVVMASQPVDEAYALVSRIRGYFLAASALAALLAVAAAVLLSRRIQRPIEALAQAARTVAGGDYRLVLPRGALRETDALTGSFDVMVAGIQARGRAILASLAEGVVLHDGAGRVTTANDAAERLLGVSPQEMVGRTVLDGLPRGMLRPDGSALPPDEHPVAVALRTGSAQSDVEVGISRPGTGVVWLSVNAQPVRLPGGEVAGVVSSYFDVTQRRQALQRSEEHLRTMADNVPDAIVRFDRELRILFANQSAAAAIGAPVERLLGKARADLMPPEQAAFWDEYLLKIFRTGLPDRLEFGREGPEGRHYESRLVPERGRDGEVETVLAITRDITDRKRAERQLLASREQLRELVARLNSVREEEKAHLSRELHDEMGQILTALRMELEALEDVLGDEGPTVEARALVDRSVAASELVGRAIDSMRNLLASLRPVALDRLGLGAALRQECRRFQDWAGIPCELAATEGLSSFGAEVDTALFRIAQEALTNVARHAGASRAVVALQPTPVTAVLRVEDDGCGVPAGREAAGLGVLGMRERAERLGGSLVLKAAPGGGTMVEACVPLRGRADGGAGP